MRIVGPRQDLASGSGQSLSRWGPVQLGENGLCIASKLISFISLHNLKAFSRRRLPVREGAAEQGSFSHCLHKECRSPDGARTRAHLADLTGLAERLCGSEGYGFLG